MKRKTFNTLLVTLVLVIMATPLAIFAGTATGSAATGNGGQDCAKISKRGRDNTGALTVGEVRINGGDPLREGVDYKVRAGTNNSTRPVIEFTNPLPANANVSVRLGTGQAGTFTVVVELEKCKR